MFAILRFGCRETVNPRPSKLDLQQGDMESNGKVSRALLEVQGLVTCCLSLASLSYMESNGKVGGLDVQQFRGGLVFKAFVSLNSRLESNTEEEGRGLSLRYWRLVVGRPSNPDPRPWTSSRAIWRAAAR